MTFARLIELGRHLSSRARARQLREQLIRELGTEPQRITVDLEGVQSLSDSFADEFFAVIADERGEEWFRRRVVILNPTEVVRAAIVRAIQNRLEPGRPQNRGATYELAAPPPILDPVPPLDG